MLKKIASALLISLSVGCAAPQLDTKTAKPLVLEEFFAGKGTAEGVFKNTITGSEIKFGLKTRGTWDGKILTLIEDFTYEDGRTESKSWRFTKVAQDHYKGQRDDMVGGPTDVRLVGDEIRFAYNLKLATSSIPVILYFSDVLGQTGSDTLLNLANVYFLGLKVGEVRVIFKKID